MGLLVTEVSLVDFRNFEQLTLELSPSMTALVGPNATGKTNTVEAVQLLTSGASFRRPAPAELVREGAESARIDARLAGDGRVIDLRCDVTRSGRRFSKNGKRCRAADMPSTLVSVLFSPDDLSLVKGGASGRRAELDFFARQVSPGYARVLSEYQRAVEQRNLLLHEEVPDESLLSAWDASVALGGATLLAARLRLFSRLSQKVSEAYSVISGGEELACRYCCTLGEGLDGLSRDELRDRFLDQLEAARACDLRRHQTTVGPHRDDIRFEVGEKPAREYASQGQQRSVALALKMAEVELTGEIVGTRPILLLDDVMSELDETRRAAMLRFIDGDIQTLITTTNLDYFPEGLLERVKVVDFGGQ